MELPHVMGQLHDRDPGGTGWDQRSCVRACVWACVRVAARELISHGMVSSLACSSEEVGPAKPCDPVVAQTGPCAGGRAHQGRVLLGQWCAGLSGQKWLIIAL